VCIVFKPPSTKIAGGARLVCKLAPKSENFPNQPQKLQILKIDLRKNG
jgi:hypothetical protein